ncbi:barstar family protein [Streptomyces flavofungini]|uniref:barstar family protein n=1 Tax=Streptomyces flavofungini TaxID=68200 RepID=UPI0025AFC2D2|nr:barstar family protein [Streptomyces flavofungini]WJV50068.1 barstar family protein [Streptomyces flavofungini]
MADEGEERAAVDGTGARGADGHGAGQQRGPVPPSVLDAVRGSGWATLTLDLTGVHDKGAFMDRCADALTLPDWFGRNWDALADCLTDLSWADDAPGRLLVVSGWWEYAEAAPGDWAVAQEVFADAVTYWQGRERGLEVVLVVGPLSG